MGSNTCGQIIGPSGTEMICHGGKPFPMVANGFPLWETISHAGKLFPTGGNLFCPWDLLVAKPPDTGPWGTAHPLWNAPWIGVWMLGKQEIPWAKVIDHCL